jgi:glycosyltransferase involved in cell wall biosynthesis
MLLRRSDDYHLLIVGDGVLRSWLESQVQALGLEKAVTLTGPVPHDRVPGLIRRMDVALAPYPLLENFYFSPLKLFEYIAVGRPVVASRIGQIQEVVQDGETGLLVPPGDPQALVDQIERLRRDQNLREGLGRAAALQARNYTWERNARQVAAIGERLLRTRGE